MPFSHHSHSGQFCGHATNTLEEMVQTAIGHKMTVFALTEHMPRDREEDLYPEEVSTPRRFAVSWIWQLKRWSQIETWMTPAKLITTFDAYYHEAVRLRELYAGQIKILIGMEIDWIRPSSRQYIEGLLLKYQFDLFIGSVHHVHTIPIDYHAQMYVKAREQSGGTDENLFEDYFEAQYEMLEALKPPIVGHFDLIRLKSDDPERSFDQWPGVWRAINRNLEYIAGYGGLLELNSASLRKGMSEPYPKAEICKVKPPFLTKLRISHNADKVEIDCTARLRCTNTILLGVLKARWSIHLVGRQPWHRSSRTELREGR